MKYLIIGAGGTGGCIGGYLANSGQEVTFLARGEHLKAMQEKGLTIYSSENGIIRVAPVKAVTQEEYTGKADVIFVCVKGYSLDGALAAIRQAAHAGTVIIPVLNALSARERLAVALPGLTVLNGCIYVSAYISAPGEITQGIKIFRLVFGAVPQSAVSYRLLERIREDLAVAGLEAVLSDDISRDVFRKFSFTSAYAATGTYFDVPAGELQREGRARELFIALLRELQQVMTVLGIRLDHDLLAENLDILAGLAVDTTASLQKDLKAGKPGELDELIFDVVRIAEKQQVTVPHYRNIARHFGYSG